MTRSRCGTNAGYVSHGLRGEPACEDCKRGKRDYARELRRRRDRERYGVQEPTPEQAEPSSVPEQAPKRTVYPETWLLPKGSKIERFEDGEPTLTRPRRGMIAPGTVLIVDDNGREHALAPDDDDLAPRATPGPMDLAWRERVRLAAFGHG